VAQRVVGEDKAVIIVQSRRHRTATAHRAVRHLLLGTRHVIDIADLAAVRELDTAGQTGMSHQYN